MEKLRLNQQNLVGVEVLSRAQLKNVLGGSGSSVCDDPDVNSDFDVCYNCCIYYMYENTYPGEYDDDYNPEIFCSDGC